MAQQKARQNYGGLFSAMNDIVDENTATRSTPTTETVPAPQKTTHDYADQMSDVANFDPALGSYNFANLGQGLKFADMMSRAGEMLPSHLRDKIPLCLAVTMRALQWRIDPFALAQETYQAKDGGVIGYQAKVFVAALRTMAGISLDFRFEGEYTLSDEAVTGSKGGAIAPRRATGDRRCIASYTDSDGRLFEFETPKLDDIGVKNSPLWHNDPRQQLAYYAGRGWTRRHRPDVIMGAYSDDEVEDMPVMKDVTPKKSGLMQHLEQINNGRAAQAKAAKWSRDNMADNQDTGPDPADENQDAAAEASASSASEAHTGDKQAPTDNTPEKDAKAPTERSDAFRDGFSAFSNGRDMRDCPYEAQSDNKIEWLIGFRSGVYQSENKEPA
ncbi:MAG: hypothetical protein IIB62_11815 [Proteobacteria bacterium]|nr:hypothetical protein [Pseudomonadota bacterium]